MNHYSKDQWILYKKNEISQEEMLSMEEHLYLCDDCMNIFLSLIDEEELKLAEDIISESFTENVIAKLDNLSSINQRPKVADKKGIKKKKMIENIFVYYVAAASVILVLTAGGVFTRMTEIPLENIREDNFKTHENMGNLYAFTEKITDNTNNFINNFGTKTRGGE